MIRVRFLKATGAYNRGETAGFPADEAAALIAAGNAVTVEAEVKVEAPDEPKAKAKPKA